MLYTLLAGRQHRNGAFMHSTYQRQINTNMLTLGVNESNIWSAVQDYYRTQWNSEILYSQNTHDETGKIVYRKLPSQWGHSDCLMQYDSEWQDVCFQIIIIYINNTHQQW